MIHYILRRRKLGRTSAREICRKSQTGIKCYRNDNLHVGRTHQYNYETNRYHREALPTDPGYVFRWGCLTQIPGNATVVNSAQAIQKVNDKAAFRKLTADEGLAPKTWLTEQEFLSDTTFFTGPEAFLKPVVVRRSTHAQGRHLHVCRNRTELRAACARYGTGNFYISELINKVAEYRVFFSQGRVVWVARKTPGNPEQVAWNVAQGGRFDNVNFSEWPLKAIKVSLKAFELSGLDFGGVDVMVDGEDNAYVLEINSAPSQTSPYRQECVAKAFDYIVRNGKAKIPVIEERGGWKKFIHPAVSSEAILV